LPCTWNNGILVLKEVSHLLTSLSIVFCQQTTVPVSQSPLFQYSIVPWPRPDLQRMRIKTLLAKYSDDHPMFQRCRARAGQHSNCERSELSSFMHLYTYSWIVGQGKKLLYRLKFSSTKIFNFQYSDTLCLSGSTLFTTTSSESFA